MMRYARKEQMHFSEVITLAYDNILRNCSNLIVKETIITCQRKRNSTCQQGLLSIHRKAKLLKNNNRLLRKERLSILLQIKG